MTTPQATGTNRGDTARGVLEWTDTQRRPWLIELSPERIILRSGADTIDLPADCWARDVLVAAHGADYVIRVETFALSVGFVVSAEQADPLLRHLGCGTGFQPVGRPAGSRSHEPEPPASAPLLWPRVSPLAVWALISSALVFVPILGLLPAVATVILLILHRSKVRRVRAWNHSRALCTAAFVFLVSGLVVNALATRGMLQNFDQRLESPDELESAATVPSDSHLSKISTLSEPQASACASSPRVAVAAIGDIARAKARGSGQPHGRDPSRSNRETPLYAPQQARAHHLVLAAAFWDRDINWGMLAASLLVILLSLSVHETGHAITAWWLGDDFARRQGRVTLKPTAHIDPFGTVVLPLILFLANAGVFGWARPVPVRTECLRRPRRDHILVSLAGPGSNLLMAAGSLLLLLGLGCILDIVAPQATVSGYAFPSFGSAVSASGFLFAPVFAAACTILQLSFLINVLLACFNLIPIPPLDGSWVLEHLFPNTLGRIYERIRPFGMLLFLGLIFSGLLKYLLLPVLFVLGPGFLLLQACTPF